MQGSGFKGFPCLETSVIANPTNSNWSNFVNKSKFQRIWKVNAEGYFSLVRKKGDLHLVGGYDIAEVSKNGKPLVEKF